MGEGAVKTDRDCPGAELAEVDSCNPQATASPRGVVVSVYGRPFELSEDDARKLAWALVSSIEEIDRSRRC